jgi:hypothetical protein
VGANTPLTATNAAAQDERPKSALARSQPLPGQPPVWQRLATHAAEAAAKRARAQGEGGGEQQSARTHRSEESAPDSILSGPSPLQQRLQRLVRHASTQKRGESQERIQTVKASMRALSASYQRELEAMTQRVARRPLLIEEEARRRERVEARRRALIAIKESLDRANVKEQSRFFDADELEDLDLVFDFGASASRPRSAAALG